MNTDESSGLKRALFWREVDWRLGEQSRNRKEAKMGPASRGGRTGGEKSAEGHS